jgi:hypothetical protein
MNEYRNRKNGQIMSEWELRSAFPLVALPAVLDYLTLDSYGFDSVLQAPAPAIDIDKVALRDGARMDDRGNWVYAWRVEYLPPDVVAANAAAAAQAAREAAKQKRDAAVAAITVNVGGLVFDGDELSQGRMARAILAMETAGIASTPWTLANNAVATVSTAQLRAVLAQATLAQTAMWAL